MIIIPTYQKISSKYVIDIELNGTMFSLHFLWNTREEFWYMNIFSAEGDPVITGIKIVPKYALLEQFKAVPGLPEGDFFVVDNDQNNPYSEGITYDNFGTRYSLLFITTEEIENGV